MAGEAVSFVLSLQDQISGPARNAAASLGQVDKALAHTDEGLADTGEAAKGLASRITELGAGVKGVAPSMGALVEQSANLAKSLATPEGAAVALTVAALALASALAIAGAALVSLGYQLADAHAGLVAVGAGLTGSAAGGMAYAAAIGAAARASGAATDKLAGYARELGDAKLAASDLRTVLATAGKIAVTMGDEAAGAFTKSAIAAAKAGQSVSRFAADATAKLGPAFAIALNRPSVAIERLKASAIGLFENVDPSPLGAAINSIADLFDRTNVVGQALGTVIDSLFGGIGASIPGVAAVARGVLEELTITALKVAIAFKPIGRAIVAVFEALGQGDGAEGVITAIAWAARLAAGFFAALGGVIVAAMTIANAPIAIVAAAIGGLVSVAGMVVDAFISAKASLAETWAEIKATIGGAIDELLSLDWIGTGVSIVTGIASGIAGSAGAVLDALMGAATGAVQGVKSFLGIASPSRLMAEFGGYTAEGFAQGIDSSAGAVAASAEEMAAAPVAAVAAAPGAAGAAAPAPAATGGNMGGLNVGGITITITGVPGAESLMERLPTALADAFESIAESMGVGTRVAA